MSEAPRIFVQQQPVLDTGQIVSYGIESIELRPFSGSDFHVLIVFQPSNNDLLPISISNTADGMAGNKVTVSNFKLSEGGLATSKPLHIANYFGNRVLLSFSIFTIGTNLAACTKLFSYTITSVQ